MRKSTLRLIASIAAVVILISCIPIASVDAASEYPNTHVNTGNMAADIVAVAESQYGYCEGSLSGNPNYASTNNYQKYGLWYDNNVDYIGVQRAAWCAAFVSWCANQAGIPSSIVYYHAYCPYGVNWFKNRGQFQYSAYHGGSYTPKAGDIIYFGTKSESTHIGIVRYSDGTNVYTVEGNTSGAYGEVNEGGGVFKKYYPLNHSRILGYGIPAYQDNSGHKITFETNGGSAVSSVNVKNDQTLSEPTAPTKYGFDFGGWFCNPELTDPYDFSSSVSYGFTLYAKWNEAYWGANVNLMPVDGQLTLNNFQDQGAIWPYYNSDGSVTLYNGVTNGENWSWPSAYMTYANSFDSANDAYIYVKKDGTAQFNADITYMDNNGQEHTVKLSQLAGNGDNDFEPGYMEFFVNLGQYIAEQGHLTESGNVKYTKVTYYSIGALDSYVKLYDMKLTPAFEIEDPYMTLYDKNVQQIDGNGSYHYDNGILNLTSESENGYTVKFDVNKTFNPTDMIYLAADWSSTTPYNVSLEVTRLDGDATLEMRKEFFDVFGYAEAPDVLPAGTVTEVFNMNGYYYWNGGLVNESTVKSITIELKGKGDFSMCALQTTKKSKPEYIADGAYGNGSFNNEDTQFLPLTSSQYNVSDTIVSSVSSETTAEQFLAQFDQSGLTVFNNGIAINASDLVCSGMTVSYTDSDLYSYTIAVTGDINGDGKASSTDARLITVNAVHENTFNDWQNLAADFDGNGEVNMTDVRKLLKSLV